MFVPIPSLSIASVFTALKPACETSQVRRIENGSARTTWSYTLSNAAEPLPNVNLNELSGFCLIAVSAVFATICEPSFAASAVGTWSLPSRTRNFSSDSPKVSNVFGCE